MTRGTRLEDSEKTGTGAKTAHTQNFGRFRRLCRASSAFIVASNTTLRYNLTARLFT
jgi:hypothetical protein